MKQRGTVREVTGTPVAQDRIKGVMLCTARKLAVYGDGVLLMKHLCHRYDRLSRRLDECRDMIEKALWEIESER